MAVDNTKVIKSAIQTYTDSYQFQNKMAEVKRELEKSVRAEVAHVQMVNDKSSPYALDRGLLDPTLLKNSLAEYDWKRPVPEPKDEQVNLSDEFLKQLRII